MNRDSWAAFLEEFRKETLQWAQDDPDAWEQSFEKLAEEAQKTFEVLWTALDRAGAAVDEQINYAAQKSFDLIHATPDDLREQGWTVAVHNDYRLDGKPYTFWLFTKGRIAVKGEGTTDAEALDEVRAQVREMQECQD